VSGVIIFADLAYARATAFFNVIQQTGTVEPLMFFELVVGTRSYRKRTKQVFESVADCTGMYVGAKISDTLLPFASKDRCTRPLLVHRERQKRETLIVLQAYVEPGSMLLDQTKFEKQCLDFVPYLDPLHLFGCRNHICCTRVKGLWIGEIT
jgi:hypothetical protein